MKDSIEKDPARVPAQGVTRPSTSRTTQDQSHHTGKPPRPNVGVLAPVLAIDTGRGDDLGLDLEVAPALEIVMIDARSDPVQDHDRGQEIAATELEGGRAVDRHHAIEKEERDPAPVLDRLLVDERIVATRTPGQVDL